MAQGTPRKAPPASPGERVVVSVDAMGGDRGPEAVVAGVWLAARAAPDLDFILNGPEAEVRRLLGRHPELAGRCLIRHAERIVAMGDKPSQVLRHGEGTSMWGAIEAVRDGSAAVAVSCGNTGALMAMSMIRLRKLPGVNRPAIACLWPSRGAAGFNVMLDVGADVRADAPDLAQYALMGAAYARHGLGIAAPRVGVLNVGTEEHKGRPELRAALDLIAATAAAGRFECAGFVEGTDIPSDRVDVIVTDGFTGNVALKTGEGTARLIREFLREAFGASIWSRAAALLAMTSLRRLQGRIDPRQVNGGVFLGLNGTVVKSHGSADATGVAAAIGLAHRLARSGFQQGLKAQLAELGAGAGAGLAAASLAAARGAE